MIIDYLVFLVYGTITHFSIPVGMVSVNAIDKIVYGSKFEFNDWDPNPWDIAFKAPGYTVIWVILLLLMFFNCCFSGFRIIKWLISGADRKSLGFIVLCLENLSNMMRTIQMSIFCLYNNFSLPYADITLTPPICISVIVYGIVVFLWLDITADPLYNGKFLGMMRKPAIFGAAIIICLEAITLILRCLYDAPLTTAVVGLYIICYTTIVMFNFLAAYRIIKGINGAITPSRKSVIKITRYIIYSGVVTLMGVIFLGLAVTPAFYDPLFMAIDSFIVYFMYFLQSAILIKMFRVPKPAPPQYAMRVSSAAAG